ncbi:hypothetical protein SMACR_05507 [Sordaria macrospora]|uniref:WGS project CABT00000000 data, contig 2.26 n=2 Tax=Sordaria macrospora TaxID=5147 RepID=F7W3X7_SORMK|nr:uncharacterized protein SMAC_05507 [Sordaria macrospora k-hell]KAA8634265.1 hypothetical protein SMACR_05507 [Sordaria macrospora]WPJ59685.1 hypothetical protein SMAC4_05507 [Sordaria macrospora]CCC12330.1 unnamed protein product [Sordaria macrospora k-hell]
MAPTKPNCKPARHVSNVFDLDNLRACLSNPKFESQSGEFRGDGRNFEAQENNDSLATFFNQNSVLHQLPAPTFPANPPRTLTLVLRPARTATTTPDNRSEKIQRRPLSTCDLAKLKLGTCWCPSCKKRAGTKKKVQSVVGEKSKITKRSKLTISKKSEGQKRREKKRRERRRAEKAEKLSTDTLMLNST